MNSSDLKIGDQVTYRCANPADASQAVQAYWNGPYTGEIVGCSQYTCEVRADGWWGAEPLYRPFYHDILQVNGHEPVGDGGGQKQ